MCTRRSRTASSLSDPRTSQDTPIFDRVVSQVTITDPRHFLFGLRLAVLAERSGRGPCYVVVELPDGRKRSVRNAATDLVAASRPSRAQSAPDQRPYIDPLGATFEQDFKPPHRGGDSR